MIMQSDSECWKENGLNMDTWLPSPGVQKGLLRELDAAMRAVTTRSRSAAHMLTARDPKAASG